MGPVIRELVGVYDADGGVVGELTYVVGTLFGRPHCTLCDVTHGPVRRKQEWRALVDTLAAAGVVLSAVHRNERTPEQVAACRDGIPCVLGFDGDTWRVILTPDDLSACEGDVGRFEQVLRDRLATAPPA